MLSRSGLTTTQILEVFAEEVEARGGKVTNIVDDGRRLFLRSVLPQVDEVRAGDQVQGGVALKGTGEGVWLYPFIFRQVCANGAIVTQTLESRTVADEDSWNPDLVIQAVREGVEACTNSAFSRNVEQLRIASNEPADRALNLMPYLSRIPADQRAEILEQILDRFFAEGDRSRFGLANAVTSLARDTRDPALRWDLEEIGCAIAIVARSGQTSRGNCRSVTDRQLVEVC